MPATLAEMIRCFFPSSEPAYHPLPIDVLVVAVGVAFVWWRNRRRHAVPAPR